MRRIILGRDKTMKKRNLFFDLLWGMTIKEIKTRYKRAVFGFFWIVLNPVLQMAIIGFVFQYITKVPIDNYFIFLFSGLLPWNYFAYSITKTTPAMVFERSLIQKAKFPSETIILSITLSNAFHTIISVILFLPLVFLNHLEGPYLLLLIPGLIWIVGLTSGFSMFLAALNVKYRDVNFMVQAIVPLWFYATPVLYTLDFLPKNIRIFSYLNPMTGAIELFHASLTGKPISNWEGVAISMLVSVIIVLLGVYIYKKEEGFFVDWL